MHLGKENSSCQIKWDVLHLSGEQLGWISQSRCLGALGSSIWKTGGTSSGLRRRAVRSSRAAPSLLLSLFLCEQETHRAQECLCGQTSSSAGLKHGRKCAEMVQELPVSVGLSTSPNSVPVFFSVLVLSSHNVLVLAVFA